MKTKVIPFPECTQVKINSTIDEFEKSIEKYNYEVKRVNWFFCGSLVGGIVGSTVAWVIFSAVYYFLSFLG